MSAHITERQPLSAPKPVDATRQQNEAAGYLNALSGGLWSRRESLSALPLKDRISAARGLLVALDLTVDDLAAAENDPQLRARREQGVHAPTAREQDHPSLGGAPVDQGARINIADAPAVLTTEEVVEDLKRQLAEKDAAAQKTDAELAQQREQRARARARMPKSLALSATAHHEAGHAVVAWEERVGLRYISIVPDADRAGFVHHAPIMGRYNPVCDNSPQVRIRGERLIRVCLAGVVAQRKFNPRSLRRYHGESDHAKAADMILRLAAPGEHADTYMRLLHIETRMLVDRRWGLIQALAAELLERRKMTGPETTDFIRAWRAKEMDRRASLKN